MSQREQTKNHRNLWRSLTEIHEFMILFIIIGAVVLMTILSPIFFTSGNILATLLSLSIESIIAIGMTVLMVSGGFDMSVGSTVGFTGAMAAMLMSRGIPVILAIMVGIGLGVLIGMGNGLIVSKIGINPFITTLGMLNLVRGLLLVITKGKNITGLPDSFKMLGQGKFFNVQYPILIAIILVIIGDFLLRKSQFFRQNYYIGGNERAALLSGINVSKMKVFNYALAGGLAAFAGIIMTARLGAASVSAGTGLELRVISAVIIGGASLQGGEGTVAGAFLGTLLMALIQNSLTLLGVDVYWNTFVIGTTLLVAVMIDTLSKKRKGLL
ncbi:ABC transporter permease [Atribacter laminatus]|jgi:ribose transport system permease protein|uniref:Ribose import permease protein RbsC n=1 Tax=Atribacter laminatus TaxID=2847778 RepID=A0A7T1AKC1_ATRLM|nr:ABC transporter permease [Atribacter laminatus]QPM67520.1 Ribose import permease protein RbsC [Atribacter laminatus]